MHQPNKTGPITQQYNKTNIKARNTKNPKPTSTKFISKQTINNIINLDIVWHVKLGGVLVQVEPNVIGPYVVTLDS